MKIYKDNGRIAQGFVGTLTVSLFRCNYATMYILVAPIDHVPIRVGNVLECVNIRTYVPVAHQLS